METFEYYVLECSCEYRIDIVICSVPNYGIDYCRSGDQKVEEVLQKSSNLSVKVYLHLVVHDICRLSDLNGMWET